MSISFIFGALWRIKALFESGNGNASSASKDVYVFSDMMNETKEFPMPELVELGAQQMLDRARTEGLLVPLKSYSVHVCGASTTGMSPKEWITVKEFWTAYLATAGADLISYSAEVQCGH